MVSCLFALVDLAMYNHALEEQLEEIEELRRDELICLPDDLEYERYFQGTLKIFLCSFIHSFIHSRICKAPLQAIYSLVLSAASGSRHSARGGQWPRIQIFGDSEDEDWPFAFLFQD